MADLFAQQGIKIAPPAPVADRIAVTPTKGARDLLGGKPSITQRNANALNAGVSLSDPKTPEQAEAVQSIDHDRQQMEVLARTRFTPEKISSFKDNPITFWQAGDYLRPQDVLPGGGLKTAYDIGSIALIAGKMEKGEQLSEGETETINKYIDREVEMSMRGFSVGGAIAYGGSQMPAFMVEFALTGGAGKLAQKAAVAGAEKLVKKAVISKVTGVTANIAARTVAMPGLYAPKYAERRLNDFTAITDKGELLLHESKESPAKSALLAVGYTSAEVASEMAGGAIGKYLVDPVTKAVRTPLISAVNHLPTSVKNAVYQAYKAIKPNAQISKVFTAGGWNGMIEELGEERVNDIMQSTLALAGNDQQATKDGQSYGFEDFVNGITPNSDQLLIEAGIISLAGGAKTAADITINLLKSKGMDDAQAQETLDNMSANEQEDFVNNNIPTPSSVFPDNTPQPEIVGGKDGYLNRRMIALYGPTWKDDLKEDQADQEYDEDGDPIPRRTSTLEDDYQRLSDYADENPNDIEPLGNLQPRLVKAVSAFPSRQSFVDAYRRGEVDERLFVPQRQADIDQTDFTRAQELEPLERKIEKQKKGGKVKPETIAANERKADRIRKSLRQRNPTDFDQEFFQGTQGHVLHDYLDEFEDDEIDAMLGELYDRVKSNSKIDDGQGVLLSRLPPEDGGTEEPVLAAAITQAELAASQVAAVQSSSPPPVNDEESVFNRLYRQWINELQPIQSLPDQAREKGVDVGAMQDTKLLSSTYAGVLGAIRQNLQVETFIRDADGNNVVTGKALKSTMDDFDNMFMTVEPKRKKREKDFSDYLVAKRYLDDLSQRDDVIVTQEQKLQSVETMTRLAQKYGQDFTFFETFAQEVYDFQRRILQNLVRSGVMSQERFDEIIAKNKNYIPFDREIDKTTFEAVTTNGIFTNANANRIIKRIKGSDKQIKNVFQSIIKNTAQIIDYSARNEVARSIASFEGIMPDQIQRVAPTMVKRGTAKVKVTYDAKLRAKLQSTAKALGADVQRLKNIKSSQKDGLTLGSYSSRENLVRLRIGTEEGTLAHEIGHLLDYSFGLKDAMLADPKVKAELQTLAEQRLGADLNMARNGDEIRFVEQVKGAPKDYIDYIKNDREIIANFFDLYINSPRLAQEIAPSAVKSFEKIVKKTPQLAFINDIKPSAERAVEEIEQDVWSPSDYAPQGSMTVFVNGEKKFYRVSKPILEAVNGLTPAKLGVLEKIFSVPATILRAGATLVPEFWVRNVLRDQHSALLQSGVRYTPADFVKGLFAVMGKSFVGKSELYNEWEKSGGSFNSFMEMDDRGLEKAYEELFRPRGKMMRYLRNPIRLLEDLSMSFEQATRIGVFHRARQSGQASIEAALTSRDATLNFSRRGSVGKTVNRIIPFFNAGVQGTNKLIRTFREHPAETVFWGVATITIPSLLITGYYLYGAPDDERAEYLEIPQWQKDMFWTLKVGGEWVRYPKPFSFGYIFGSLPERVMLWGYDGNKPEGEALWQTLVLGLGGAMSPIYDPSALIPPLAKVAIEDITNYNFFMGRPIYPDWMDRLEPSQRYNKYTSDTAKLLGEQLNISPAIIDNTVRGIFAGAGDHATDAADTILRQVREWNGDEQPEKPVMMSDIPLIKAFAVRRPSGYKSNSAANFFETWKTVQQKHATLGRLDGEEKAAYAEKNRAELSQYKTMKGFYDDMRDLQKEVDALYDDEKMSSEDKVQKIEALEDQITQIAREANMNYSNATGDEQ